jgi:hypothetical protein
MKIVFLKDINGLIINLKTQVMLIVLEVAALIAIILLPVLFAPKRHVNN